MRMIRMGPNQQPRDASRYMKSNYDNNNNGGGRHGQSNTPFNIPSTPNIIKDRILFASQNNDEINYTELCVDSLKLKHLFCQLDVTKENAISLDTIKKFLHNTKLEKEILAKIWDSCGIGSVPKINFDIFTKIIKMISFYSAQIAHCKKPPTTTTPTVKAPIFFGKSPSITDPTIMNIMTMNDTLKLNGNDNMNNNFNKSNTDFNNVFIPTNTCANNNVNMDVFEKSLTNHSSKLLQQLNTNFQQLNDSNQQKHESLLKSVSSLTNQLDLISSSITQYNNNFSKIIDDIQLLKLEIGNIKKEHCNLSDQLKTMKNEIMEYLRDINTSLTKANSAAKIDSITNKSHQSLKENGSFCNISSASLTHEVNTNSSHNAVAPFVVNSTTACNEPLFNLEPFSSKKRENTSDDPFKMNFGDLPITTSNKSFDKTLAYSNRLSEEASGTNQLFNQKQLSPSESVASLNDTFSNRSIQNFHNYFSQEHLPTSATTAIPDPFNDVKIPFDTHFPQSTTVDPFRQVSSTEQFSPFQNGNNQTHVQDPFATSQPFDFVNNNDNTFNQSRDLGSEFQQVGNNLFPFSNNIATQNAADPFNSSTNMNNEFVYDIESSKIISSTFNDPFKGLRPDETDFNNASFFPQDNINSGNSTLTNNNQFDASSVDNKDQLSELSTNTNKDNNSTASNDSSHQGSKNDKSKKKGSIFKFSANKKKKSTITE